MLFSFTFRVPLKQVSCSNPSLLNRVTKQYVVRADLSDENETENSSKRLLNIHSLLIEEGLDVLVHNASVYSQTPIEELSLETMRFLNRLHVEAPLQLSQGLVHLLASVNGSIVGMTDTSAGKAWEQLSHYTSSKAGLRQLMFNLAGEYAPRVRVNCVAPGAILSADWEHEHFNKIVQSIPLRRSGDPGDVAGAVFFLQRPLTSPDKSCLLTVDGLSILRKDFIQALSPESIEVAEVVKGAGLKIRSQMGSRVQNPSLDTKKHLSETELSEHFMQNRLTPARFPYVEGCLDHVFQSLRICSTTFAVFGSCSAEQPCRIAPRRERNSIHWSCP